MIEKIIVECEVIIPLEQYANLKPRVTLICNDVNEDSVKQVIDDCLVTVVGRIMNKRKQIKGKLKEGVKT